MFMVTCFTLFITILNIIVYHLRNNQEQDHADVIYSILPEPDQDQDERCRRFSLAEIKSATLNFNESLVIGRGGFGKVYKGVINSLGTSPVAMKRLELGSNQGSLEFWTEIDMLSKFRHSHLLPLIGYCKSDNEMILVYEYMPGGTLEDHIHSNRLSRNRNSTPIPWEQRLKICIGAARGLEYLHTGTGTQQRVIHRDVKSSNILLDKNLEAKVSDFGLSRTGPSNHDCTTHIYTNNIKGTFGYMDAEYFMTRRLTRKSDVYAFGVVLFEVLCGRPAVDLTLDEEQHSLAGWARRCTNNGTIRQIIAPSLRCEITPQCLTKYVEIAYNCLSDSTKKRPTMSEVVVRLESALTLQKHSLGDSVDQTTRNSLSRVDVTTTHEGGEHHTEHIEADRRTSEFIVKQAEKTFIRKIRSLFSAKFPAVTVLAEDKYLKSLQFDFGTIKIATCDFSEANNIGWGSTSIVYKGRLPNGLQIAVKRFSAHSIRNPKEYRNELLLLSKLQHRNLAKLLGYCMEGDQMLLIHEYLPNRRDVFASSFQSGPLNWETRYRIMVGVARGLVYLHEDSSMKILHQETNMKHILLDENFDPKISDFGLARRLPLDAPYCIVSLITGSMGFMAPEYVLYGHLSLKLDVFNFGVFVLELVTGKKANGFILDGTHENFLLYVWKNWKQEVAPNLMDPNMDTGSSLTGDIMRCIQIGLLCSQHNVVDRPNMATVVLMLSSPSLMIPVPKEPPYSTYNSSDMETDGTSFSEWSIS
ncbi:receptor like protein kinase S.2-like protein [Tanacetum coccineum]